MGLWQWVLVLLGVLAHVSAVPVAHESRFPEGRTLTDRNFTSVQHGAWLIEFYSPKCPHCQRFAPVWAQLNEAKDALRHDPVAPLTLARVDCLVSMDLCVQEQVRNYPQLSYYQDGVKIESDVKDDFSLEGLSAYVDKVFKEYRLKQTSQSNATHTTSAATTVPSAPASPVTVPATTTDRLASSKAPESLSLAPLPSLVEYGSAALPNEAALDAYLGPEKGQGPSFVKCTPNN